MDGSADSNLLPLISESEGLETRRLREALRRELDLAPHPEDPVRLGRFVVLEQLGEGGMGTVFAAFDPNLDRRVALKILRRDRRSEGAQERLLQEARTLARLDHPNVVRVFEVDELEDEVVLVMELVPGGSLRAWVASLDRGLRDWWRPVVHAYAEAAAGLIAAHAIGVVHRDFKPTNAMRTADGRVCVVDFGLARGEGGTSMTGSSDDGGRSSVEGTPGYMAPEQRSGLEVDARADQYALCVSLLEAITGVRDPDEARLAAVPKWLRAVLERGRAPQPDARYPSMAALRDALLADPAVRRRRLLAWGLVGAVGVGSVAVAYEAGRGPTSEPCAEAGQRAHTRWSSELRQALGAQFLAAAPSFGAPTWARIEASLSASFEGWAREAEETCAAHEIRDENGAEVHGLRVACLDRTFRELDALVVVFEQADASDVASSPEAVARLPDPARCGDVDTLLRGVLPPPPAVAQDVARFEDVLAKAQAEHRVGRESEARTVLEVALPMLPAGPPFEPLRVRMTALLGELDLAETRSEEAMEHLHGALWAAVRVRDLETAAVTCLGLARLDGVTRGRVEDGLAWVERGEAFAEATAAPAHVFAELALARADLLYELADDEESKNESARARSLAEPTGDPLLLAKVDRSLGRAQRLTGDVDGSLERLERSVQELGALLGPAHPAVFSARNSWLVTLRRVDVARAETQTAMLIEDARRDLPADHLTLAEILDNVGLFEIRRSRFDQARVYIEEALKIVEARLGSTSVKAIRTGYDLVTVERESGEPEAARARLLALQATAETHHPSALGLHLMILHGLGNLAAAREDWQDAETQYRRAIALSAENLVPPRWSLLTDLSSVLKKQDDLDGAAEALATALALQQSRWGPDSAELEPLYVHLGNLDLDRKRWADAEAAFQRALQVATPVHGVDGAQMAAAHLGVGRARSGAGDPRGAIEPYVRAVAAADAGESGIWRGWTRFNLAQAKWDAGVDRAGAIALAKEAVVIYGEAKVPASRIEAVEQWLALHRE